MLQFTYCLLRLLPLLLYFTVSFAFYLCSLALQCVLQCYCWLVCFAFVFLYFTIVCLLVCCCFWLFHCCVLYVAVVFVACDIWLVVSKLFVGALLLFFVFCSLFCVAFHCFVFVFYIWYRALQIVLCTFVFVACFTGASCILVLFWVFYFSVRV